MGRQSTTCPSGVHLAAVERAYRYVAALDHPPCRTGSGCTKCASTIDDALVTFEQVWPPAEADFIERQARSLLSLWYELAASRGGIVIHSTAIPSYDPGSSLCGR